MHLRILSLLLVLILPFAGEARIIETTHINDVIPLVDAETWILVDLDNTLYEGKQALGHTEWFYDNAYKLMKKTGMNLEEATRECYPEWIEVQKICPVKAVDKDFVPALLLFQQRGIVVMGLTHRQPSLAEATLKQVNSLGFDFSRSAPAKNSFAVPSATPTLYIQGILFTGEYNTKGEIFARFLSMINQKPKKALFIDDKLKHVKDVESTLIGLGIETLGVHYRAIEQAEKVYYPEIAQYQYKFFKSIMSNEAALLLMQHGVD